MTGIVHLGPRLSVNCSPLSPIAPLCPPLQNPNPFSDFPKPNVHLIKARLNPLPSIQNSYPPLHYLLSCPLFQYLVPPSLFSLCSLLHCRNPSSTLLYVHIWELLLHEVMLLSSSLWWIHIEPSVRRHASILLFSLDRPLVFVTAKNTHLDVKHKSLSTSWKCLYLVQCKN